MPMTARPPIETSLAFATTLDTPGHNEFMESCASLMITL
jgi:hypothetical protein